MLENIKYVVYYYDRTVYVSLSSSFIDTETCTPHRHIYRYNSHNIQNHLIWLIKVTYHLVYVLMTKMDIYFKDEIFCVTLSKTLILR